MQSTQPSLFDTVAQRRRGCGAHARYHSGDDHSGDDHSGDDRRLFSSNGAWVDMERRWLDADGDLFESLLSEIPWQSERRRMYDRIVDVPRLFCFYGDGQMPDIPVVRQATERLNCLYRCEAGAPFTTVGMCLYRSGSDSVAWHGDTLGRGATEDTMVAIVSLGAKRRFLLRPRAGGPALRLELGDGDLLVMGGSCQRTWEHSVPKTTRPVGPRISLQFRPPGVA